MLIDDDQHSRVAYRPGSAAASVQRGSEQAILPMIRRQAISTVLAVLSALACISMGSVTALAASEVYIEQAHGHVTPGTTVMTKPPPETAAAAAGAPVAAPAVPDTCNAQNASSSQACYTATQQARPGTR
jgi:hypothetical protein